MGYSLLNQRLDEFRCIGKYCDVNVQVQDTTFHCHRLVLASMSKYFDSIFDENNINESSPKDVVLNIMDAVTFKTILEYVYEEESPTIDSSNVEVFLKAGSFLEIDAIVSNCEDFIHANTSRLPHRLLFQLFGLSLSLNIRSKDYLSEYITQNLMNLVQQSVFLEVPYETLRVVLERYRSCVPYSQENFLLDGLIRWIFHSYHERRKYFKELVKIIDFEKISVEYVKCLSKRFKAVDELNITDKTSSRIRIENLVLRNENAQDHEPLTVYEDSQNSGNLTIHLFCQDADERETRYKIFSLDEKKVEPEWICSRRFSKQHDYYESPIVQFITFNDCIYCFEMVLTEGDFEARPSFSAYSSIDFSSESPQILSPFPLVKNSLLSNSLTRLSGFGNDSIYLYSSNIYHFSHVENTRYVKNFNEEEYNRNFYMYNLTQDEWLPVHPMIRPVEKACLITDDELVYLIGGKDKGYYSGNESIVGYAQAYNPRSQTWLKLPRTNFSCENHPSGCNLNGKIYVWNGEHIEVYDPQAKRWQAIKCEFDRKEKDIGRKLLIPFKNQLYLFDFYYEEFCTYNPVSQEWSSLIQFENLFNFAKGYYGHNVMDILVFKSF